MKYKFIGQLEDGETIDEYPIECYFKDSSTYKLIDDGDWENIDIKELTYINKDTESLLFDVQSHYKKLYGGKYKYNVIDVTDDNGNIVGSINLRISDHTENIFNVDRFNNSDYHISVIISNYDPTKKRFAQTNALERKNGEFELRFNSADIVTGKQIGRAHV